MLLYFKEAYLVIFHIGVTGSVHIGLSDLFYSQHEHHIW